MRLYTELSSSDCDGTRLPSPMLNVAKPTDFQRRTSSDALSASSPENSTTFFPNPLFPLNRRAPLRRHRKDLTVYRSINALTGLDRGCLNRIENTRQELAKARYPVDSPHVIASLSFGFWVSLLGPGGFMDRTTRTKANYEMTLWRPALRRAFPHAGKISRKGAHMPLDYLRTFRNRIAHHEPVFSRHLEKDYQSILEIAGWIAPHMCPWIEAHSRVPAMLAVPRDSAEIRL